MSLISRKKVLRLGNRDILWNLFECKDVNVQTLLNMANEGFSGINIPNHMRDVLKKTCETKDRFPKIAMIIFGIWLVPTIQSYLMDNKLVNPRYFVPWIEHLHVECENMLHGRHLTLQSFVLECIANYMMGPPSKV